MFFRVFKGVSRAYKWHDVRVRGWCQHAPQNLVAVTNQLDHTCRLQFDSKLPHKRLTSIICSIGPASDSVEVMEKMLENGMNIARLSFLQGSYEDHCRTVINLREAAIKYSQKLGHRHELAIGIDTKQGGISIGSILDNDKDMVQLKKGQEFRLSINKDFEKRGTKDKVYVNYPKILKVLEPGIEIFFSNSSITLKVKELQGDEVICKVQHGGILKSHENLHIPLIDVDFPIVTEQVINDLKFGLQLDIDLIFAAHVRNAANVEEIRSILGEEGNHLKIISKIENSSALENIEEIIDASDGIMVARGALGISLPPHKVFLAQKSIIARCNKVGKPVICATQMLRSMIHNPRPTRAEISDVANAVVDGADCVMMSEETSIGEHPVKCVEVMAKVCPEAESAIWHYHVFNDLVASSVRYKINESHFMVIATVDAALKSNATAILVISNDGLLPFHMSKYRPPCPIIAVMPTISLVRQSFLYRGLVPIIYEDNDTETEDNWLKGIDDRVNFAIQVGKSKGIIQNCDPLVIVTEWRPFSDAINSMRIVTAHFEEETEENLSDEES